MRQRRSPLDSEVDHNFYVPDWSFQSLFDRSIDVACPVASSSTVHLVAPNVRGYKLSPEPVSSNNTASVYSLTSRKDKCAWMESEC